MSRKILFLIAIVLIFAVPVFADEIIDEVTEEVVIEEIATEDIIVEDVAIETTEIEEIAVETEIVEVEETEVETVEVVEVESETEIEAAETVEVAETETAEEAETVEVIEIETAEYEIPYSISNNPFFRESVRLTKLAQDTFEYGDYEASTGFAEQAIVQAQLSDEYVADKLIIEAKRLVDWADFYKIAERHPHNVQLGKDHYENAVAFQSNEEWNEASDSAIKSIEVLSVLRAGTSTAAARPAETTTTTTTTTTTNNSQYTVRTWAVERDCFWNISGYAWVYGDPWQWRKLYEANKHKIPDPNNPDLIEPGTVLDIPR